jgi:hypothetical protein
MEQAVTRVGTDVVPVIAEVAWPPWPGDYGSTLIALAAIRSERVGGVDANACLRAARD